jgi:undecaprenyl diphosphate synthase
MYRITIVMKEKIELSRIPRHVAIIMDGNGRWAKKHGKERAFGHQEGVVSVRKVVEAAAGIGIKYLTLYTFSTENWKRPQAEIDALMALMVEAVKRETGDLIRQNVRLLTIGDISRMPQETIDSLNRSKAQTAACTGLHLVLALSYSSRWEITEAVKQICTAVKDGSLSFGEITEETLSRYMTTQDIPDPDLLIRTGGEYRISNFLMWQLSYSELYFTDTFWPEFREESLYKAVLDYQSRERRFGMTGEQVRKENKSNPSK